MKLLKKWLFPVLTCLIVAGAAVLPARVSQARDARQFGQIHTEELKADALPEWKGPSFLERLEMYICQYSYDEERPVLSFHSTLYYGDPVRDEVIERAKDTLTQSGILPNWYFTDEPFEDFTGPTVSHTLLWDPADSASWQEPSSFWLVTFQYHSESGAHYKNLSVVLDDESGLPITLALSDTNMAKWLPYKADALRAFMERYFDALGLEVQLQDSDNPEPDGLVLSYLVSGTNVGYTAEHNATLLSIGPYTTIGGAISPSGYDG